MTHQSSLRCSFQLLVLLLAVPASVMTLADAGEFSLLEVRRLQSRTQSTVTVKFQGPAPSSVALLNLEGFIGVVGNEVIVEPDGPGKNMTIRINVPDALYTLVFNELEVPRRVSGQRRRQRYRNESQAFPDVNMTLPDVTVYSAGDDVTFNVDVSICGVDRDGVVGEELTFETYVKNEELIFHPGPEDLLSVRNQTEEQGGSTVYRVELDTGEERHGLAIVKAFVQFSPNASLLVRSMQVERMTEFYSTEKGSALLDGSFAFLHTKDTYSWYNKVEVCDMDLPECDITCTVIGKGIPADFGMIASHNFKRLATQTDTTFGVITTLTHTSDDVRTGYYQCVAKAAGSRERVEQTIELKDGKPVRMLPDISAAEMHANQTLEVRCAAYGKPTPKLSITADDDPSTPLSERFPSESYPMRTEIFNNARLRYMLNKPSFTSTLTHVTCTGSNKDGDPVNIVLQITPAA